MNAPARNYSLPPHAANEKLAEEFGKDLFAARIDPSDDEECFRYLADLYPNRLKEVLSNYVRGIYEAGQFYIESEMSRITQDN